MNYLFLDKSEVPDIQLYFCPLTADRELLRNFNFKPEVYEKYFDSHLSDGQTWTIGLFPTLLHPK